MIETVKGYFDEFFESCKIGLRKPDVKFFNYALDKLDVKPNQVIFLDDISVNIKAAKKIGIKTIRKISSSIHML
ncbi:HAD-like domain-containing protein [Phakopsora pachyrhizi]|nr:HAD-like domain-containing protein [Phakopsora pachyrhizi]